MIRLAFLASLALPNVVFGQVDVTFVGSSSPYESSWDGKLLAFEKVEDGCFGYAEFRIEVTTPVSVTYFSSLFCEDRSPAVEPPFDSFSNIRNDWAVLGSPSTWFGNFTVNAGTYTDWFINFDVKKLWLGTDLSLNGGAITADVDINPWVFGFGFGKKF